MFQYKKEERSSLAKRALGAESQLRRLVEAAKSDVLSSNEHIDMLGYQISQFTGDQRFAKATSMGVILELALLFVIGNYKDLRVI